MKMFFVRLTAILALINIFIITDAKAQWVNHFIDYGEEVWSISSKDNKMFAGTYILGVCVSSNAGNNWSLCPELELYKMRSFLVTDNKIYAGGDNSRFYVTTNDGINWNNIPMSVMTNITSLYRSGEYIIAGTIHSLIRSSNFGINWISTNLNITTNCLAANNGKVIAGTTFGIYESGDDGATWTLIGTFYGVRAVSRAGNNLLAGTMLDGVYYSSNDGNSWQKTSLTTLKANNFIVSDNKVYAGTDSGVYVSTNSGVNWVSKNEGMQVPRMVLSMHIYNNRIYIGTNGQSIWSRPLSELVGIEPISLEVPSSYSLEQNYPNPFNPNTVIRYQLPVVSDVVIKVYDVQGREVQTLVNERLSAGRYEVDFDGSSLTSGVYFYQMRVGDFSEVKRMVLLK